MTKPKLLLHTCCAPCSGYLSRRLSEDYAVSIYFDNSNIYPKSEYDIRLDEAKRFFSVEGFEFIESSYGHKSWQRLIAGLEAEPERGRRCKVCYHYRLTNTANYAQKNGFDFFSSTLAVSPHKDALAINNIGQALGHKLGVKFLSGDWKKQDGFKKAMELSHQEGFYHQNYCGCEFSIT